MHEEDLQLLSTPYELGGDGRTSIDCAGVAKILCERRGVPPPTGWLAILEAWRSTGKLIDCSGFPRGWRQLDEPWTPRDLDVLVFYTGTAGHPWCATVDRGYVWSASLGQGVWRVNMHRWHQAAKVPNEIWRWQP